MKKQRKIIGSLIITGCFLILAFGSDDSSSSSSSSSQTQEKNCVRCGGSGKVATYSGMTCDFSHFETGDCYGGHKSGYNCVSTGSKTCPCCNGKGKKY